MPKNSVTFNIVHRMFAGKIQLFHEIGNFVNGRKISLLRFRNGLKLVMQIFHADQQKAHY